MSEHPESIPGRGKGGYLRGAAPPSAPYVGGSALSRIGAACPTFIARADDRGAASVLGKLESAECGVSGLTTWYFQDPVRLLASLQSAGIASETCVPIFTTKPLKDGRFALAGSRRGRSVMRFPAYQEWVAEPALASLTWYQIVLLPRDFTRSHGPLGIAQQLASWIR